MTDPFQRNPIKIPVRLVDGRWEFFYGGDVPVDDDAIGELVVDKVMIYDQQFFTALQRKSDHMLLEVGTELLVALTVKSRAGFNESYLGELIEINDVYSDIAAEGRRNLSGYPAFVSVYVCEPTGERVPLGSYREGGVWLRMEGLQPKSLVSGAVKIPIQEQPADSLNHALTLLSEAYEPWRKSHTGNIYRQVLYRESNGKWYPLDVLRRATEAKEEHQYIREQWARISNSLNLDTRSNT